MEQKPEEEHLDNDQQSNEDPSSNIPQDNNVENDTPTLIEDNNKMEVHHHSAHHGKKNWKSYIWEFLMLFFAVFCGFLAEYQLEHSIEQDREKQYIESMVADMMEDSAKISISLDYSSKQLAGFDSILLNIYSRPYTDSSLKKLYGLQVKYTNSRNPVLFTKRTITQLKNSGGLRLIRNKAASDSIVNYSEECERAETQAEYLGMVRMDKINEYAIKLFDNQYIMDEKGAVNNDLLESTASIPLLNPNEQMLKEYANTITYARGSLKVYIRMITQIQGRIPSKIKFLKEKYDLR